MKVFLYDKSKWPEGPWKDEPDMLYRSKAGVRKLIIRTEFTGSLCGYIILEKGHGYHGRCVRSLDHVDVHGGVTFAGEASCLPYIEQFNLITPDDWAIGFDCAHSCDYSPAFESSTGIALLGKGPYRDIDFVGRELDSLASQLAAKVILTLTVNQEENENHDHTRGRRLPGP